MPTGHRSGLQGFRASLNAVTSGFAANSLNTADIGRPAPALPSSPCGHDQPGSGAHPADRRCHTPKPAWAHDHSQQNHSVRTTDPGRRRARSLADLGTRPAAVSCQPCQRSNEPRPQRHDTARKTAQTVRPTAPRHRPRTRITRRRRPVIVLAEARPAAQPPQHDTDRSTSSQGSQPSPTRLTQPRRRTALPRQPVSRQRTSTCEPAARHSREPPTGRDPADAPTQPASCRRRPCRRKCRRRSVAIAAHLGLSLWTVTPPGEHEHDKLPEPSSDRRKPSCRVQPPRPITSTGNARRDRAPGCTAAYST